MTLQLVRVPVDINGLYAFAVANRISDDDGGYALHRALRDRLGSAGPQPFRFLPDHRGGAHLLGYTTDRQALEEAAALPMLDDRLAGVFAGPVAMQAMPETWRAGARYGFEVRVRPVVRFGREVRAARGARDDAWLRKAQEIDAHVAAKERAERVGDDPKLVDRETVYVDWLAHRLEGVATLEDAALRQFRTTRTRRNTHGTGTREVEGPDALMGGTLTIVDPDGFARVLARGIGRHAAFGHGMVLLSPARRGG